MAELKVVGIKPFETHEWLEKKHYAHRIPSIAHSFGLYLNELIGVITYGIPPNNSLNEIAGFPGLELNRLCVNDNAPKNSASILVSHSLKMLPSPLCVISYADCGMGHVGYIYQATNFIYTGMGASDTEYMLNGKVWHRKALFNKYGAGGQERLVAMGFQPVKKLSKHRYLYFIGNKKEKKLMLQNLSWPILPYPKGDTSRYNADHEPQVQSIFDFG